MPKHMVKIEGATVKALVKATGLTATELAKEMKLNRATINYWKKQGRIPLKELQFLQDLAVCKAKTRLQQINQLNYQLLTNAGVAE
jgi:transcriptional regulator with XRE-family HTH domain